MIGEIGTGSLVCRPVNGAGLGRIGTIIGGASGEGPKTGDLVGIAAYDGPRVGANGTPGLPEGATATGVTVAEDTIGLPSDGALVIDAENGADVCGCTKIVGPSVLGSVTGADVLLGGLPSTDGIGIFDAPMIGDLVDGRRTGAKAAGEVIGGLVEKTRMGSLVAWDIAGGKTVTGEFTGGIVLGDAAGALVGTGPRLGMGGREINMGAEGAGTIIAGFKVEGPPTGEAIGTLLKGGMVNGVFVDTTGIVMTGLLVT
jgi:hypothetical protein